MTTSSTDTLTGTDADETFYGVNSSLSTEGTLQVTDTIDGGAGTDTIELSSSQKWDGFTTGSMTNVETVKLTNDASTGFAFNATGITGVSKYEIDANNGVVTLSQMSELAELDLTGPTGIAADVAFSAAYTATSTVATGSQTDTQKLKVTDLGTTNAKYVDVTIAKVEAVEITTAGTANSLNLTGLTDTTALTISGEGTTEIETIGTKTTSFDASGATGNVTTTLTGATSAALATVKTGAGDDTINVHAGDMAVKAVVDGGTGADVLSVGAGAGSTLQNTMTGVETIKVGNITSALTYSGLNVDDVTTIDVTGLSTADAEFKSMDATTNTINMNGNNVNDLTFTGEATSITYNLNGLSTTVAETNVDAKATLTGATSVTVNVGEYMNLNDTITASTATDLTLNVASKVSGGDEKTVSSSTITAAAATSLTVNSSGHLDGSTIVAAKATSATVTAGSTAANADVLVLTAAKLNTLTINSAKQDFSLAGSALTELQTLTVTDTVNDFTMGGVALADAATITVGGTATTSSATFGTLGTATTQSHVMNLTATGLKAGLTTGAINAGTSSSTINVSGVAGDVTLAAITADAGITLNAKDMGGDLANSANALTTTTGNISVDVSGIAGTATLGALTTNKSGDVTLNAAGAVGTVATGIITGKNVSIDGTGAINTVTVLAAGVAAGVADVIATTSVDYKASDKAANRLDIDTEDTSSAFTASLTGTAQAETITIQGGTKQESITVTGDLKGGVDVFSITLDKQATITKTQTVDVSGLTSSATAGNAVTTVGAVANVETTTDISAETVAAITYKGSVKDDHVIFTAAADGTHSNAISITDATSTDTDSLTIDANGETVVFTKMASLTGFSTLNIAAGATADSDELLAATHTNADDDVVFMNASAISGLAIAVEGDIANDDLALTGTADADVIDLSKVTDGGDNLDITVVAGAGNDTIVLSTSSDIAEVVLLSAFGTNGKDTISNFDTTEDHLNLDNTMTGVTDLVAIVGINAGGEEQDFTDNEAYVFADGASAVAGGTATDIITDYTNLTQVGAFISDALTIGESNGNATDCDTLTGDEALFVVNDLVADLTYVYHFKEDGTATDASAEDVVSSGELTIIGVVSEESDAALVAADIV